MVLGTLIIKERLGLSNRKSVEQITENPYLQYFMGLSSFQEEAPFHVSTMSISGKRMDASIIHQVNEWLVEEQTKQDHDDSDDDHNGTGRPSKDAQAICDQKQVEYRDAVERNVMEGKFGEGKRSYRLGLISACLQTKEETVISVQFLIMNLEKILRDTILLTQYNCKASRES